MNKEMWSTIKDLEEEIEEYNAKIEKAKRAMDKLPKGFIDFKKHKKRTAKKTQLKSEIRTARQIIIYAKEAIANEM